MLEALDRYFVTKALVYSNHTGNMTNMRSHSGIIIYVNNAPIILYRKCQNRVKSSSFGLVFISPRTETEIIEDLKYKLMCFRVPL